LKSFQWALAVVGLIMGLMLAFQFRVTREVQSAEPVQKAQKLSAQVDKLKEERDAVQSQIENLRSKLDEITIDPRAAKLKQELDRAMIEAGMTDVKGPGVEVTLKDSNISLVPGENPNLYVLHDEDLLRVLNELKAAGAEAISINGQRLLATTEVRCIGPAILINKNKRLTPPYVISAVGNPDTLESSLKMKGGVAETLQFWGIQVAVEKKSEVTVPAFTGGIRFEYGKAVTPQGEDRLE